MRTSGRGAGSDRDRRRPATPPPTQCEGRSHMPNRRRSSKLVPVLGGDRHRWRAVDHRAARAVRDGARRHPDPAHPQGRARGRVGRGGLRQAARRVLLEPAARGRRAARPRTRPRPSRSSASTKARSDRHDSAGRRRGGTWTSQGPNPIVQIGRTTQHLPGGVGPDRRAGHPHRRDDHPGRGPGRHVDLRRDRRHVDLAHRRQPTPSRSAPWPSRRATTTSSTWAPVRAPSPATATTATASTSPPTAASPGRTSRRCSPARRSRRDRRRPDQRQPPVRRDGRGRGGNHRTTPPDRGRTASGSRPTAARTWTLRKGTTDEIHGATDLVMDPQNPNVLWASFWGDGIYRSTDGGQTWASALGNLPAGNFLEGGTRFSLGHLAPGRRGERHGLHRLRLLRQQRRLPPEPDLQDHRRTARAGRDADRHRQRLDPRLLRYPVLLRQRRSSPTRPTRTCVYVARALRLQQLARRPAASSGPRTAAQTWKSLGYDLHPDFHAFAFQPNDTQHVVIGNDGGVWQSPHRRRSQRRRRPAVRGRLGEPQRHGRPGHRRA